MPHLSADTLRTDPAGLAHLVAVLDSDPRCRAVRAEALARLAQQGGQLRRSRAHFGLNSSPFVLGIGLCICVFLLWLGGAPGLV